ncbi:MAG: hypothetical protein ACK4F8_08135 [Aquabacterium sp.]
MKSICMAPWRRLGQITLMMAALMQAPAGMAAPFQDGKGVALEALMSQRLPSDASSVVITEPTERDFQAVIDSLPQPGKTEYMAEALAARRIAVASPVTHKMWLRTTQGERAMVYVPQHLVQDLLKRLKAGDMANVQALQLWNSRHGPGLLLRDITRASRAETAR